MAKTKEFSSSVDLPIDRVHSIVSSEQYLTTTDEMVTESNVEIQHAERQVGDDGEVRAEVSVVTAAPQAEQPQTPANPAAGSLLQEPAETGDEAAGATEGVTTTQSTIVTPPGPDGSFRMISNTPLPNGMGEMATTFAFAPAGECTDVNVQVMADVKIPIVGGKLAKKLLGGAETTVNNGLERIARLDARQRG